MSLYLPWVKDQLVCGTNELTPGHSILPKHRHGVDKQRKRKTQLQQPRRLETTKHGQTSVKYVEAGVKAGEKSHIDTANINTPNLTHPRSQMNTLMLPQQHPPLLLYTQPHPENSTPHHHHHHHNHQPCLATHGGRVGGGRRPGGGDTAKNHTIPVPALTTSRGGTPGSNHRSPGPQHTATACRRPFVPTHASLPPPLPPSAPPPCKYKVVAPDAAGEDAAGSGRAARGLINALTHTGVRHFSTRT
ncbi:hypothetical protein E2C01_003916 [Portunus trituberculatus]|uniref:Uncharacterized protein n=1 Tax=Portunus trituberculatus TaxID=210409 RepID=A0A5B7CRG7_PORTR|nr:hypothetical protein [Portunus trituberculatus]